MADFLKSPAGALTTPGLIEQLIGGNQSLPYQGNLTDITSQLGGVANSAGGESQALFNTGSNLITPLTTGQLPTGAQNVVDQIVQKQQADTKAKYAQLGQTGSTMEQSALNDINTNKGALTFQIAQQMAQTGLQATQQSLSALGIETSALGGSASIYSDLMKAQMAKDNQIFQMIGQMGGALGKAAVAA